MSSLLSTPSLPVEPELLLVVLSEDGDEEEGGEGEVGRGFPSSASVGGQEEINRRDQSDGREGGKDRGIAGRKMIHFGATTVEGQEKKSASDIKKWGSEEEGGGGGWERDAMSELNHASFVDRGRSRRGRDRRLSTGLLSTPWRRDERDRLHWGGEEPSWSFSATREAVGTEDPAELAAAAREEEEEGRPLLGGDSRGSNVAGDYDGGVSGALAAATFAECQQGDVVVAPSRGIVVPETKSGGPRTGREKDRAEEREMREETKRRRSGESVRSFCPPYCCHGGKNREIEEGSYAGVGRAFASSAKSMSGGFSLQWGSAASATEEEKRRRRAVRLRSVKRRLGRLKAKAMSEERPIVLPPPMVQPSWQQNQFRRRPKRARRVFFSVDEREHRGLRPPFKVPERFRQVLRDASKKQQQQQQQQQQSRNRRKVTFGGSKMQHQQRHQLDSSSGTLASAVASRRSLSPFSLDRRENERVTPAQCRLVRETASKKIPHPTLLVLYLSLSLPPTFPLLCSLFCVCLPPPTHFLTPVLIFCPSPPLSRNESILPFSPPPHTASPCRKSDDDKSAEREEAAWAETED